MFCFVSRILVKHGFSDCFEFFECVGAVLAHEMRYGSLCIERDLIPTDYGSS